MVSFLLYTASFSTHDTNIPFVVAVRFADLTGNGRGDYLCIEPDGRISGYVQNDDGSWTYTSQIKFSVGYDRANLRFADVNGDGRDDMIWVNKWNGDGHVL